MSATPRPHPSLEVLGGAAEAFLPILKTLHQPYKPYPFIGWNRHVETIFAAFFRKLPEVRFKRECLRTPDDGSVALGWVSGDDGRLPPDSPLLVLLDVACSVFFWCELDILLSNHIWKPGLTGGSDDTYVRHMLIRARNKGWRVVVFNSRGCADSPVTTPQVANDPISPSRGIPRDDIKENPNCVLVVTPQGGHLGWVAGAEAPLGAPWTDPLVVDFLEHLRNGQQPEDPDPSFNIDESEHNPSENLESLEV
ncbi:hypothetical protein MLD38_037462 [Melastoma candidum]|uniref:Uncharacterized protein n=1 Tax=Melastoma candidum TaxID=119954 RepID=A0ACB9LMS2_9MYRT|nr:hypothetical protein MLD38_037462 [Melastoma candidum]